MRGWQGSHQTVYAISNILVRQKDDAAKPDIACLYYGDLENETPEQFVLRQEEATLLNHALARLYPREERVIRLWYGIGAEKLTLDQIGEQYGVTRERIRQISCKAERKLLQYLRHDFRDRYKALAKRRGWTLGMTPTVREAEDEVAQARYEAWQAQHEKERAWQERLEAERLANLKATELSRLEVERIRAENVRRYSPPMVSLYVPRLIDPRTGAWEWVKVGRSEINDASAA